MSEKAEHNIKDIENARMEIGALMQEMAVMGANDFEPSAINEILTKLDKGELSPAQAIEDAKKIRYSKQDYH